MTDTVKEPEEWPHMPRLLMAWSYLDAAEVVSREKPRDALDLIEVVANQLLAQALEITFKAYLSWSGFPERAVEDFGHDLIKLRDMCRKLWLATDSVDAIVDKIAFPYAQHWYRYPTPGEIPGVDVALAVPVCRPLWHLVHALGTQDGEPALYGTGTQPLTSRERRKGLVTKPDLSKPFPL